LYDEDIVASLNSTEAEDPDSESDEEVQHQICYTQAF